MRRSSRNATTSFVANSPSVASEVPEEEEIICPWLQDQKFPLLVLPESSSDLLIESNILFPAAEIYETCRTYYRLIQISPFLFEDFCCALRSPDQTRLLAEIHISFIRLFFRDDEDAQTSFCSQDTNNCFNIMIQLLDGMTYAEILRYYLESDPRFECNEIIKILGENYPFVEVEKRITVLKWLCDFFLQTYTFRQLVTADGQLTYDDVCRDCGKPGDVLLCDGCEACYHMECANLEAIPEGQWFCQVCQLHLTRDAIDIASLSEAMTKHEYRIAPLGFDRHGRWYWFFAKRIFIHEPESGSIYYYSTLPQLYELVRHLDPTYYEKDLCLKLSESLQKIARHMSLTLELTRKHRDVLIQKIGGSRQTPLAYLDFDNSFRMANILGENFVENVKMETDSEETESLLAQIRQYLQISDGHLKSTFWSGNLNEQQLSDLQNSIVQGAKAQNGDSSFLKTKMDNLRRGYRLAFGDGRYREYQNEYSVNELAKPSKQRSKERDKKKYLSARFALTEEGEFTWAVPKGRDFFSSEANVLKILQVTVRRIIERLPNELLHRLWISEKQPFLEKLSSCTNVAEIRYLILQFERAIRKPVFSSIWWNSLGLTKLMRVTSDDREDRSKLDAIKKKEEKALQGADSHTDPDVIFVKYLKTRPSSLSLWRLRDEAFRLNNRYQMGGWLWVSSTLVRNFQDPSKVPKFIDYMNPKNNEDTLAVKKVLNLYRIAKRISVWREHAEKSGGVLDGYLTCYSSNCTFNPFGFTATLKCYNPNCPRTVCEFNTPFPSKAYKGGVKVDSKPVPNKAMMLRRNVRGEGQPFPFPKPFSYLSRASKKRSLLIIPQSILRRIARQGGTNAAHLPGFNKQAKSNTSVWLYPCPRPLFDNCWRYLTLNVTTLHGLALSLRTMFSCIRWSEMEPDDKNEERVVTHFPDHDERRHIISHKEHVPDGYYEQYKLKIHILSIDDDGNDDDGSGAYRSGGSLPRSRKRKAPKSRQSALSANRVVTKITERWIDGVELFPYEITTYWVKFNKAVTNGLTTKPNQTPASVQRTQLHTTPMQNSNIAMVRQNSTPLSRQLVYRPRHV